MSMSMFSFIKLDQSYEADLARKEAAEAAIVAFRVQQAVWRMWDVRSQLSELSFRLGHYHR